MDVKTNGQQYLQVEQSEAGKVDANGAVKWSTKTIIAFILGNASFILYCIFVIPKLLGPNRPVVYGICAYILSIGLCYQLPVFLATGLGADYGKFTSEGVCCGLWDKWASTVPISISWWTMEQPSFIVPAVFLWWTVDEHNGDWSELAHPGTVYLGMFMFHYFQRSFIYPWFSRGNPYPAFFWTIAVCFTTCNGTLMAIDLLYGPYYSSFEEVWCPRSIFGIALFFFGMGVNIQSDQILARLRKPGETGYKIPQGGMFEYISGANLWGEAVEWTGLAVASRAYGAIAFAVFCWAGIGCRCVATHRWYLKKFGLDSMRRLERMFGKEAVDQHIESLAEALERQRASPGGITSGRADQILRALTEICSEEAAASLRRRFPST